jgi:hypothetical protein
MKRPAFQLYTGDWLKDPALAKCSAATRGIWIDLICAMHENGRTGNLTGTIAQLARISRTNPKQMKASLDELRETGTALINFEVGSTVSITNRRMAREFRSSELHNNRQDRYRAKSNGASKHSENVTPERRGGDVPSSSSSSSSSSEEDNSPPTPSFESRSREPEWERLVETGKQAGMRGGSAEIEQLRTSDNWQKLSAEDRQAAVDGIQQRIETGEFADPAWVPTFAVYLRQRRWERPLRPKPKVSAQTNGPPGSRVAANLERLRKFEQKTEEEKAHAHT